MAKQTLIINGADNVAVALCDLSQGEVHEGVTLVEDIPQGHKFALSDIPAGAQIVKYGCPVARAVFDVPAGAHIHTHNARTNLGNAEYSYNPVQYAHGEAVPRTVNVYRRANGAVGIRNELWIIPVTGSVNGQADLILKTFKNRFGTKGIDGAYAFTHTYGFSQSPADSERTRVILQKLVRHPNAGGVLVLGLGDTDDFRVSLGGVDKNRVKFLNCLEVEDEIESGVQLLNQIAEQMKLDVREPADISCLKIGLKCGNVDNLSGITANPLVGMFTDNLVAAGGTVALCEIYEAFGAEQLIMNRAKDEEVYQKILSLINTLKDLFRENRRAVYVSPSIESMNGGITTIEEQSVMLTQKAGLSPVNDVVQETEFITRSGLNILIGRDDDMCAVTNLAAAGCHLVLFTTGTGTPLGGCVPTVKISSNSSLASKKSNWIDFNAGAVLDTGYEEQLEKLTNLITAVAGGKLTKNEVNNTRGIAISVTGITL